jgi:enoyl-CoA hydratase/carnithine racemase
MATEIIGDHDVSRPQRGREKLFDIGTETAAVDRPVVRCHRSLGVVARLEATAGHRHGPGGFVRQINLIRGQWHLGRRRGWFTVGLLACRLGLGIACRQLGLVFRLLARMQLLENILKLSYNQLTLRWQRDSVHESHKRRTNTSGARKRMAIEFQNSGEGIFVLTLAGTNGSGYLDTQAILHLAEVLQQQVNNTAMRVLLIRGNDGMFCRGRVGAKGLTRASDVAEDLNAILKVNAAMDALSVPIVTALEGEAFGFGFGITAQSDYAVAAADSVLALPEMSHGLPPLVVLSYLFRFVPYKRAFELALNSRRISGQEAKEAGIVTEVVPPGQAVSRAMEVARGMTTFDAKSLTLLRKFSRHAADVHSPHLSEHAVSLMSVFLSERAQAGAH